MEERRREQDRFHQISSDLFAVVGFDGILRSVNPACTQLLGYEEQELLSRPYGDFIHPDDHDGARQIASQLQDGLAVVQHVNRMVAWDGQVV